MDPKQQRCRIARRGTFRERQVRRYARAIFGRRFHAFKATPVEGSLRRRLQPDHFAGGEVDPNGFCREFVRASKRIRRGPVRRNHDVGIGGSIRRHPGDSTVRDVDPEKRPRAVVVRCYQDGSAVREPCEGGRSPAVPLVGEWLKIRGLAPADVHQVQFHVGSLSGRRVALALDHQVRLSGLTGPGGK